MIASLLISTAMILSSHHGTMYDDQSEFYKLPKPPESDRTLDLVYYVLRANQSTLPRYKHELKITHEYNKSAFVFQFTPNILARGIKDHITEIRAFYGLPDGTGMGAYLSEVTTFEEEPLRFFKEEITKKIAGDGNLSSEYLRFITRIPVFMNACVSDSTCNKLFEVPVVTIAGDNWLIYFSKAWESYHSKRVSGDADINRPPSQMFLLESPSGGRAKLHFAVSHIGPQKREWVPTWSKVEQITEITESPHHFRVTDKCIYLEHVQGEDKVVIKKYIDTKTLPDLTDSAKDALLDIPFIKLEGEGWSFSLAEEQTDSSELLLHIISNKGEKCTLRLATPQGSDEHWRLVWAVRTGMLATEYEKSLWDKKQYDVWIHTKAGGVNYTVPINRERYHLRPADL